MAVSAILRLPGTRGGALVLGAIAACGLACTRPPADTLALAVERHVNRGDIALARREPALAERAYRSALAASPDHASALLGLARALAAQEELDQALERYGDLAQQQPQVFEAVHDGEFCPLLLGSAEARLARGESRGAVELAERSKAESCDGPASDSVLARALLAEADRARLADRPLAASDLYQAAVELDPSRVEGFLEAGALLLEQGHRREALELLSAALLRHPADQRLHALMVEALAAGPPKPASAPQPSSARPAAD